MSEAKFKDKALEIAALVEKKRGLYGDSFGKTGEFLRMLYPDGIRPEQYGDMLTIARVFDKLCRAATSSAGETESPWDDVMGYALLAATAGLVTKDQDIQWIPFQPGKKL